LTIWFLAFLAGASLAICIPAGVRARRNSPYSAAQLFKKRMSLVAPRSRGGRWVIVPDNHDLAVERMAIRRARRRRKTVAAILVLTALGTGVWALVEKGVAIEIHLVADAVLVFYIALVSETKRRRTERATKVRRLSPRRDEQTAYLETAHAGGGRH
jgi:hypothetical protein